MAALRRELPEELIGEILLRLPPNQPHCPFRLSLVSQAWRTFFNNPTILRQYRKFHGAPPVLGFVQNDRHENDPIPRFFPTTNPFPPLFPPFFGANFWHALDCRHGRVLVHNIFPLDLVVWNPINGEQLFLPEEPLQPCKDFTGAVLCAVDGCDHLDCRGGPFRVVFAATADEDVDEVSTWASLYSSETGYWTEQSTVHPGPLMDCPNVMGPSLLAGDALYFTLDLQNKRTVLRYDLGAGGALSVMDAPLASRDTFLVTGEDGGLGFAAVEDYSLRLWSWNAGAGKWVPRRVIDLEKMIPFTIGDPITVMKVIGFAEMSGIIYVSANGIISTVELKSGRVVRGIGTLHQTPIFPFEAFYTLGMDIEQGD